MSPTDWRLCPEAAELQAEDRPVSSQLLESAAGLDKHQSLASVHLADADRDPSHVCQQDAPSNLMPGLHAPPLFTVGLTFVKAYRTPRDFATRESDGIPQDLRLGSDSARLGICI